jgi:ABC-2 type transport system ATP-binding protein
VEHSIIVEGLTKRYGDKLALDGVSFKVERGEVFGYLGPNGAGKSTTINILSGLIEPTGGTAFIDGHDLRRERVEIKRKIGVVPEASNLYDELTVRENLGFVSKLYHVPRRLREERITRLLDSFDLDEHGGRRFGRLSKGLKRRTVLAAALVHEPDILFLDEPTSGLDVVSARTLRRMIEGFKEREITVFLTTHYIEEAGSLCDRIAILVRGKIVTIDTPHALEAAAQEMPVLDARVEHGERLTEEALVGVPAQDIRVTGDRVRIYTRDIPGAIKALSRVSEEKGFSITELNTVKPSLEDAFIRLTGLSADQMKTEKEGKR